MANEQEIRSFLEKGHPPGHRLKVWSETVRSFGDGVPQVSLQILESGDFCLRPAAIYALRAFGYEAFADGYWENESYRVRPPGQSEWVTITPDASTRAQARDLRLSIGVAEQET